MNANKNLFGVSERRADPRILSLAYSLNEDHVLELKLQTLHGGDQRSDIDSTDSQRVKL